MSAQPQPQDFDSAAIPPKQAPKPDANDIERISYAFDVWRGKLIDLSKRNRALNWRPLKVGSITIVDEKPAEVYRALIGEERLFTFAPAPPSTEPTVSPKLEPQVGTLDAELEVDDNEIEGQGAAQAFSPYSPETLADRHRDSVLQTDLPPERLDINLRRLADVQRTNLEEQGVNTLYLALGFLHYKEAQQSAKYLKAPLVMVPVELRRQSARAGFQLVATDDEPVLNPSLAEYLRRVHQVVDQPALSDPTDDAESLDLIPFFARWANEVAGSRGWKVTEEIALAHFAFQKLVIFKDLEAHQDQFGSHRLVRRVALKDHEPVTGLPPGVGELDLDREYPPEATAQVLDTDSSQMRALIAVAKGHDLVVHGPPGTGKSQTIANLIADALNMGKRVLFVSEKMAALEVVHRRLAEAELSDFCLELHSTRARKGTVIDDLRRALQSQLNPAVGVPSGHAMLVKMRAKLNSYTRELHTKRTALECTAYHAIGEFATAYTAERFTFQGDPTTIRPELVDDLDERLQAVEAVLKEVAPVIVNGWRDARLNRLSEEISQQIAEQLERTIDVARAFLEQARGLAREFGLPEPSTPEKALGLSQVADHLASAVGVAPEILRDSAWIQRPSEVSDLLAYGRRYAALRNRFSKRYHLDELEAVNPDDVKYVEQKRSGILGFLAFLDARYRSICKRWREIQGADARIPVLDQVADFKRLPAWQRDREVITDHDKGKSWFGLAWRGPSSDWDELDARMAWIERFHAMVKTEGPLGERAYEIGESGGASHEVPSALRSTATTFSEQLRSVIALLHWPAEYFSRASGAEILTRLEELWRDRHRGPAWVAAVRAVEHLDGTLGNAIASAALNGSIVPQEVRRAFRRCVYGAWLEKVLPSVPELSEFSSSLQEEIRLSFQQADRLLLTTNRRTLASKLRETGASSFASSPTKQRAFLQKELAKQKRHRPLRVLLGEAGEAIAALKPCFMMSPLSVSQFLAGELKFDLVVFDEASQLPTEDAIAAICRGRQLVVVGDPKQLPPTNFFAVQTGTAEQALDDSGDPILEETESVLEEYQGCGLHEAHLEWHYRSAHESLIQFSNAKFYADRLIVFPSALSATPDFGVQFEYVCDGCYQGAGVNPVEAVRVAHAAIEHFKVHPDQSLGIGTFSQRQQLAILDELERLRREEPALEPFFDRAAPEPFFVKNLENIQGDERDVILLSITYGKNADGKLHYNFGPLNRQEGWRRLNVLVSRARQRMRVFSSLHAADVDPTATATQGPALLRDFLYFAETGRIQSNGRQDAALADSPFEHEVGETIQEMGYLMDRQVGVGPYRIDLGVRHPSRPGVYLAGIECDGAAYHSAPWARDRDRLRQQVLELRGWTIIRVWSTDWFKDRAGTLKRLRATLDTLAAGLGT